MSAYEMKKLEMELKAFVSRNFEKPTNCKNLDQIRFYVKELCAKIEELELSSNYVPEFAYTLLAQYNSRQNVLINSEFKNSYQ